MDDQRRWGLPSTPRQFPQVIRALAQKIPFADESFGHFHLPTEYIFDPDTIRDTRVLREAGSSSGGSVAKSAAWVAVQNLGGVV
jgi:hypothetical protein